MFPPSSINLWMNNSISFRGNHVLLLLCYICTHTFALYSHTNASPHLCTPSCIYATNDMQKSHDTRLQTATGSVNLSARRTYRAGRYSRVVYTFSFHPVSPSICSIPVTSIGFAKDFMNTDICEYGCLYEYFIRKY